MNRISHITVLYIAGTAALCLLPSASWSDQTVHYGRAGGAVGADRIKELESVQRSYHAIPEQTAAPERYGRAGGPIGAEAVARTPVTQPASGNGTESATVPNVYGRSGTPIPFQN